MQTLTTTYRVELVGGGDKEGKKGETKKKKNTYIYIYIYIYVCISNEI